MNRHLRVKFGHIKYKKSRARGSEPHIPPPPPPKKSSGGGIGAGAVWGGPHLTEGGISLAVGVPPTRHCANRRQLEASAAFFGRSCTGGGIGTGVGICIGTSFGISTGIGIGVCISTGVGIITGVGIGAGLTGRR